MMNDAIHLTGLELDELTDFVEQAGEPKYRANQIFKGLHERRLRDFDEMTDLPKVFREKLRESATASTLDGRIEICFRGRDAPISDEHSRRSPGRNCLYPDRESRHDLFFVAVGMSA